jgi:hypothetical protein
MANDASIQPAGLMRKHKWPLIALMALKASVLCDFQVAHPRHIAVHFMT